MKKLESFDPYEVTITLEPYAGSNIVACMEEASMLALSERATVKFLFNDKSYSVSFEDLRECVREEKKK